MIVTGKRMKELREEAGLSQAEVARLAKVSQAHVAKIESGKVDPRLSTVNRILHVLSKSGMKKVCRSIMKTNIVSISPEAPVSEAIRLMKNMDYSQLPVMDGQTPVGSVDESSVIQSLERGIGRLQVKNIMKKPFPVVDVSDVVEILPPLFDFHSAVLVAEKGRIKGIITKSDLLGLK